MEPVMGAGHSSDGRSWHDGVAWRPAHSSDGRWWWDGAQWLPAVSSDGRWVWDGLRWWPVHSEPVLIAPARSRETRWRNQARDGAKALFVLAGLALFIGAFTVMGDPAPGQAAALDAAKAHNMSVTVTIALSLAVAGAVLLAVARWWRRPAAGDSSIRH